MTTSPPDTLPSTVEETLARCSQFRILVVGNSGVGKSSLVSNIFNVRREDIDIADDRAGDADIDRGYTSDDNPRFILHDSKGFEPGRTENWEIVKEFIRQRCKKGPIKDQLHAIWLCVETPRTGSRLMQTADEDLLKLATSCFVLELDLTHPAVKVPVIVAFTKYDLLFNQYYSNMAKQGGEQTNASELAEKEAQTALDASIKEFQQQAKLLKRLPHCEFDQDRDVEFLQMLEELTKITQKCLRTKETLVPWAVAQRIDPKQKVECSLEYVLHSLVPGCLNNPRISEGFKKYMKNLGKSTVFKGQILEDCLLRIHLDIVKVWNFRDPDTLLSNDDFLKEMVLLIEPFIPPPQPSSTLQQRSPAISALADIFGNILPPLALALDLAGLAIMTIAFLYGIYQAVPQTALCLEAYIIDLTLVLHELFVTGLDKQRQQPLTSELLSKTLRHYKESRSESVHQRIRNNVRNSTRGAFSAQTNKENLRDLILLELSMVEESSGEESVIRDHVPVD
ncbi:hypothetical protein DXG01_002995 [Tephrocybe rancida]|nr:hypothetical protein DXG01_002995 [Tephrocybe rancida]